MRPLLNPSLADVPPYVNAAPIQGINLASNENPYGPSPHVLEALRAALTGRLNRYPEPTASLLRTRLAEHCGVSPKLVLAGNGATELIDLIAKAVIGPGENTIYVDPSFVMYRIAPKSRGAEVRTVPFTAQGAFDLQGIIDAVDEHTKLVYLANPNNPTGSWIDRDALAQFVRALPAHVVLVLDEAYREYAVAPEMPDGLEFLDLRERYVVVRTFSKAYGLAALRVGYLVATPTMMAALERARLPFSINTLAQVAAMAALEDPDHLARCRHQNRAEMNWLGPQLTALGCVVTPSQANFLLVDFGRPGVAAALAQYGVVIRSMAPYGMPTQARITVGTHVENAALVHTLARASILAKR
jgi:histidinol-phosphate aminotransferase